MQHQDRNHKAETEDRPNTRTVAYGLTVEHELRLRRWARMYFVTADQRSDRWHPVILHEMEMKDIEEAEVASTPSPCFVPLEPSIDRRFDQQHEEMAGPHFLKRHRRQASKERLYAEVVPGEMYYN